MANRARLMALSLIVWDMSLAFGAKPPPPDINLDADPVAQLSLDEYVARALQTGIAGRKTQLDFESAGYTREIVYRQNELPTVTLTSSRNRAGTNTDGFISAQEETRNTGMQVNENTPLGTNLQATAGYSDTYGTSGGAPIASNGQKPSLSLNGTQPLYLFVKNPVRRKMKLAQMSFLDARNAYDSAELSIRTQARNNYYAVMQDEDAIQVAKRKAESSHKLLDVTQALVDAGKSAPVDAMRAKITLQSDLRALDNAVTVRDQAALTAKNYIYFPLDEPLEFTSRLSFKPFNQPLDKLVNYALLHQPNLQSLRRQCDEAFLNWQAALEPTRPMVSLNGAYNYGESPLAIFPFSNIISTNGINTLYTTTSYTRSWSWTLNLSWLIFDGGITRDAVKQALIARSVADLNLSDAERTTQVNVRNSYLDVRRTEKQIQDFTAQREQAQRNVEVLRLRFQNGLATLIDVVTAENDMRDLDNEYLSLLVQFNQSKDTLTEQLGVDVDTL